MSVTVRELSLPEDLERIRGLHNANRPAPATRRRFEWAYLENPDGTARAWGAEDDGVLVGVAVVFPRTVRLPDGTRVRAWTTGDLSVSTSHRRQGIASRLRAETRAGVDRGDAALLFAIPNPQAVGVHGKAGYATLGKMERMVRLLALPGPRVLGRLTRRAVQWAVSGCPGDTPRADVLDAGASDGAIAEVAAMYERVAPALGASVVRSERYLRWRFLDNARTPARLLVLREHGKARAFAAVIDRDASLYLRDWLAEDAETMPALVRSVVEHANDAGKAWVSVSALEGQRDLEAFARCGFRRRREATALTMYVPAGASWRAAVHHPQHWFITGGDPDV